MIDEAESALKDTPSAAAGDVSASVDARFAVAIDADVNAAVASDSSIGQCRCCCTCNKASSKAKPVALPVPTAVATAAATAPETRAADSAAAPILRSEQHRNAATMTPFPLAAAKEMILDISECCHHQVTPA